MEGVRPPNLKDNEISEQEGRFVDDPLPCVCPACDRSVISEVEHHHNWCSSLVVPIVLFLLTHLCAICIYPLVSGYFKDAVHICPRCGHHLKRVRRFKRPQISQEIITLQCGNCAVIFSKGYVMLFGLILILLGGASYFRWHVRTYGLPDIQEGPVIDATWEDFFRDCGSRSSLSNPIHRNRVFEENYRQKSIVWIGRLNSVESMFWGKGAVTINMEPHMQTDPRKPDLTLLYNEQKLNEDVGKVTQGDEVSFKATLLDLGSRRESIIGYMWQLNLSRSQAELPRLFETVLDRYKLLQQPPIAHLPRFAKHLADARNEFIQSRMNETEQMGRGFYLGDDIVGIPLHMQAPKQELSRDTLTAQSV